MSQTNEQLTQNLQNIEKGIQASEQLRQRAITSKEIYERDLKATDEELKALGTTPEKAQADLEKIDASIQSKLESIQAKIPFDLLRQYKLL